VIDVSDIAAWKCEVCHHWIGVRHNAPPTMMKVRHREFVTISTIMETEIVPSMIDSTIVVCRACLGDIESHDVIWNREGDRFHS
jgi:hypothetical protein